MAKPGSEEVREVRMVRVRGEELELRPGDELREEWLEVRLTDEETLAASRDLAKALAEKRDSEARLKVAQTAAKQEIAALDARVGQLGDKVSTGREMRYVPCILERDFRLGEARLRRCDTGAVVNTRALTEAERQAALFPEEPPPAAEDEGHAPAKKKRAKRAA